MFIHIITFHISTDAYNEKRVQLIGDWRSQVPDVFWFKSRESCNDLPIATIHQHLALTVQRSTISSMVLQGTCSSVKRRVFINAECVLSDLSWPAETSKAVIKTIHRQTG